MDRYERGRVASTMALAARRSQDVADGEQIKTPGFPRSIIQEDLAAARALGFEELFRKKCRIHGVREEYLS